MYGYVYRITDLTNNKIYIGKHKSEKFDELYFGSGSLIKNIVNEKGKENFSIEIIKKAKNKKQLEDFEKYYICLYESHLFEVGYNIVSPLRKSSLIKNEKINTNSKAVSDIRKGDVITITVPRAFLIGMKKSAKKRGMSLSGFIRFAVSEIQKGE